jgi:seryl-tRNA synthetase
MTWKLGCRDETDGARSVTSSKEFRGVLASAESLPSFQISSTSNCTDFQARRLHIRHRPRPDNTDSTIPFAHTLNGTCAAIPRLLVALLENGAVIGEDGEVTGLRLPAVLERFWIGGESIDGKAAIQWS